MTLKTDWQRPSVVRVLFLIGVPGTVIESLDPAHSADETKALETSIERRVKPFVQEHFGRCYNEEKLATVIGVDQLNAAKELAEFDEEKY